MLWWCDVVVVVCGGVMLWWCELWWCGVVVCSVEENIQHSEISET